MLAMKCACWPCCCYCSLCCCHHCCSQVYDIAATSAASSGCAADTIVATAATIPDTIASTIGECCFFCPLCYHCCPPRACLSASFSSALPSLGLAPAVLPSPGFLSPCLSYAVRVCPRCHAYASPRRHTYASPRCHMQVHDVTACVHTSVVSMFVSACMCDVLCFGSGRD